MSLVDLNRAGTPLLEIVTEPDLSSSRRGGRIPGRSCANSLMYLDVCDGNMEEGSRCEPNLSLRPWDRPPTGTKVELKNINPFKFVKDAVEARSSDKRRCWSEGERSIRGNQALESRTW